MTWWVGNIAQPMLCQWVFYGFWVISWIAPMDPQLWQLWHPRCHVASWGLARSTRRHFSRLWSNNGTHTYIYIYICTWQNSKMIKYIWTKNCWVLQSTVHIHNIPKIFTPHKDVYKWTHLWLWALTSGALVALDRSWVFSQAANGRGEITAPEMAVGPKRLNP